MDYHFYRSDSYRDEPNSKSTTIHFPPFVKTFLPVFALAILLPLFLFFATNPNQINFTSQANQTQTIQIWFEPASIATQVGVPVKVDVMAQTQNGEKTVYNLSFPISSQGNVIINPSKVSYNTPFAGRLVIESIEIKPLSTGQFSVSIPKEEITASEANLSVEVAPLELLVTP